MVAAKKMVEDAVIVRQVPLEDLHESPTNRRRNWGHLDEETAKSIAEGSASFSLAARGQAPRNPARSRSCAGIDASARRRRPASRRCP